MMKIVTRVVIGLIVSGMVLVKAGASDVVGEALIKSDAKGLSPAVQKATFSGVLPLGWNDNFGSPGEVACALHEEPGSQFFRFDVKNHQGVQFYALAGQFILQAGECLRLTVKYRTATGASLAFGLRQGTAPYRMYWRQSFSGDGNWQTRVADFSLDQTPAADSGFFLYLENDGTFDLATIVLERVPATAVTARPNRPPVFRDGDTVCFIGDSITHCGEYIKYFQELAILRQPGIKVHFVNCGISGQIITSLMPGFASDVAAHKPDYVFVMMGMNDVGRDNYTLSSSSDQNAAHTREAAFAYRKNLQFLYDRIKAVNPRAVVLLTPTPYDEWQQTTVAEVNRGCDAGLQALEKVGAEVAANNGCGYIDVHTPLLEAIRAVLKVNPSESLIGYDRVHPRATGNLVVGMTLYRELYGDSLARAEVDAADGSVVCTNCRVSGVARNDGGLNFSLASGIYPFAPGGGVLAQSVLKELARTVAPFLLRVKGLEEGRYELSDDGKVAGSYTARELAEGLDLADLPGLRCSISAAQVDGLAEQKRALECGQIRDPVAALCFLGGDRNNWKAKGITLPEDPVPAMKMVLEKQDTGYLASLYKAYISYGNPEAREKAERQVVDYERQMRELCHPWQMRLSLHAVKSR